MAGWMDGSMHVWMDCKFTEGTAGGPKGRSPKGLLGSMLWEWTKHWFFASDVAAKLLSQ